MKRKVSQQKSQPKWKRKLFAVLLLGICFVSLLLMLTQYSRITGLTTLQHQFVDGPKIAFLFIARNRLPLEMVWVFGMHFFREEMANFRLLSTQGLGFYSTERQLNQFIFWIVKLITAYSFTAFLYTASHSPREKKERKKRWKEEKSDHISSIVDWGEATVIEAERMLLRNALNDPLNDRFVFLSDSCTISATYMTTSCRYQLVLLTALLT